MAHVEAHVARPGHPHDGVEVGPIVVDEATGGVDEGGELQDVFLKEPHGIGIGEHQPRRVGAAGGPQASRSTSPSGVEGCFDGEARHGGGGRVGAVGGVGHQDHRAARVPRLWW